MLTLPNFGCNPDIPVTFIHDGKECKGVFREVNGAGTYTWFLSVNKFYKGQLFWAHFSDTPGLPIDIAKANYALRFCSQKGDLDYHEEYFCETVMLHYQ